MLYYTDSFRTPHMINKQTLSECTDERKMFLQFFVVNLGSWGNLFKTHFLTELRKRFPVSRFTLPNITAWF